MNTAVKSFVDKIPFKVTASPRIPVQIFVKSTLASSHYFCTKSRAMKKLLSTGYSSLSFNLAMLLLRISLGVLMIAHGYDKLVHFAKYRENFHNFLGLGQTASLSLSIFAEFFCSLFLIIGLFTRFTVIPLIINMLVAIFVIHNSDFFGQAEMASVFIAGFIAILLVGPGKASVDGIMGK
jgi:putative oxidoreductase